MTVETQIKQEARDLGFDAVGITGGYALCADHADHLFTWIDCGYAGQMGYMERRLEKRVDPSQLLKGARSVIVVGLNYKPASTLPVSSTSTGRIARYAQYNDYHHFLKERLYQLSGFLLATMGGGLRFKVCVDTVPVAERSLAQRAGLGFIGRNHMLIHPELGPELFLGEVIVTAPLPEDKPIEKNCGTCRKCLDACPTGALREDGYLDASRCINYLTIEYDGDIPPEFHSAIGNRLYGCDACVTCCPYHQQAPACGNSDLKHLPDHAALDLRDVLSWSPDDFRTHFERSSIFRIGLERLQRNARLCLECLTSPRNVL
ncbi:tRNA epoxyqueuosine(34) reductase QueG [Planctomycetota bacterium]